MHNLAFLDQLPERLDWGRPAVAIAMMKPAVQASLRRAGIDVQDTVPYLDQGAQARILTASEALTARVRREARGLDDGRQSGRAYREALVFRLRLAAHYCLWVIEVVLNAIEAHGPQQLWAPTCSTRAAGDQFVHPDEHWLAQLVHAIANRRGLAFRALTCAPSPERWRPALRAAAYNWSAMVFGVLGSRWLRGWNRSADGRTSPQLEGIVWVTTRDYSMGALVDQLQRKIPELRFEVFPGPRLPAVDVPPWMMPLFGREDTRRLATQRRVLHTLAETIATDPTQFTHRGIPFADLVVRKLRHDIGRRILGLSVWAAQLELWLERTRPKAVLSCGNRADEVLLAELCRTRGIPAVLISHGSHVAPKNYPERIEWTEHGQAFLGAPFSHLALASPLAEEYLCAVPATGQPIRTGPLIWGRPLDPMKRRSRPRLQRVILHAGTYKTGHGWRPYVYETPDEYVRSVRELAQAVQRLPQTRLLIKFRPSPELGVEDLRALVPCTDAVRIIMDVPMQDALADCDLLVSFSSTTIEEALQNRIPVLLYGGGGRYQHVPAMTLARSGAAVPAAVYHVADPVSLEGALREIFSLMARGALTEQLFAPYIYPTEDRVSLADWLQELSRDGAGGAPSARQAEPEVVLA